MEESAGQEFGIEDDDPVLWNGKITVNSGHEMGFLEVLDRRRHRLELVPDQPERFRGSSRVRIDGS